MIVFGVGGCGIPPCWCGRVPLYQAMYTATGWMLWQGPSSALTPSGIRRTEEDDGCIYVLPMQVPLDLSGELTCDWRDGDLW